MQQRTEQKPEEQKLKKPEEQKLNCNNITV
jgi:hypothetical protein